MNEQGLRGVGASSGAVMTKGQYEVVQRAVAVLGADNASLLSRLVTLPGGAWYLREKIIKTRDWQTRNDHTRPLKYAACFDLNGAVVEFVREQSAPSPDLKVDVLGMTFYAEVKKLQIVGTHSSQPARKFSSEVADKKRQLPSGEIGLVAIDNFRIGLESDVGYRSIEDAFRLLDQLAAANPSRWLQPSAAIVSVGTYNIGGYPFGGDDPNTPFPYFIWLNRCAERTIPDQLVNWLLSALPASRLSTTGADT